MVDVLNDPEGDDAVQALLETIADVNPEADHVVRTAYRGEVLDMITITGVSNAEVTLPETPEFQLETVESPEIEDAELKDRLIEDGKIPEDYGDETVGPAQISFEKL